MIYEYKCPEHGDERANTTERGDTIEWWCHQCGDDVVMKRVWAVNIHRPMADHFNHTTNSVIGSDRQFKEELKALSEAATLKTGIEHDYGPADPAEIKKHVQNTNAAGLESTQRARRDAGKKAIDI